MGTVVGVVLGYILRGTTGSGGFNEVLEQTRAVRDSPEFKGLVQAVKTHAHHTLRDLTVVLGQKADEMSEALGPPPEPPEPENPWARWGLASPIGLVGAEPPEDETAEG